MTLVCFEGDNNKALVKTSKNRDDVTQRTMGVSSQFASSSFQKQNAKLDVTSGAGLRHHLKTANERTCRRPTRAISILQRYCSAQLRKKREKCCHKCLRFINSTMATVMGRYQERDSCKSGRYVTTLEREFSCMDLDDVSDRADKTFVKTPYFEKTREPYPTKMIS